MPDWPLFPVTVVGSLPRPPWLLEALRRRPPDLERRRDDAALLAIKQQEDAGVDIVTDGEQRRDNFYSFLCERIDGLQLMTLAELLDHVEDKSAFEGLLQALDVPAFAIKNPVAVGRLERRAPLALDDFRFLRLHTRRAVKVTLPGPYLLCRSAWVKNLSSSVYPTREQLADDVVRLLRDELRQLAQAGCDVIQLDEPVLSELAFAGKSATRTFMCAALAAAASPEQELDLAVDLVNRVVEGVDGPLLAVHVCRGNWSRNDEVLLSGSYDALMPWLRRMNVGQLVLEFATQRAGPIDVLKDYPADKALGLGLVDPRTPETEDVADLCRRVEAIRPWIDAERIHLNPDCGFGTFADRPVASIEAACGKLRRLAETAQELRRRERLGVTES